MYKVKNSLVSAVFILLFTVSCAKKENTDVNRNSDSTTVDSVVSQDSAVLQDDSATVQTAVGVQDEEQNALKQENAAAEKLETDKASKK